MGTIWFVVLPVNNRTKSVQNYRFRISSVELYAAKITLYNDPICRKIFQHWIRKIFYTRLYYQPIYSKCHFEWIVCRWMTSNINYGQLSNTATIFDLYDPLTTDWKLLNRQELSGAPTVTRDTMNHVDDITYFIIYHRNYIQISQYRYRKQYFIRTEFLQVTWPISHFESSLLCHVLLLTDIAGNYRYRTQDIKSIMNYVIDFNLG